MVFFQNRFGFCQIKRCLIHFIPWKGQQIFDIILTNRSFRRIRRKGFKTLDLLLDLFPYFITADQFICLIAVFVRLGFSIFSQFLTNGTHLFPQIIFFLVLFHGRFHCLTEFLPFVQNIQLAVHKIQHIIKPVTQVKALEKTLTHLKRHRDMHHNKIQDLVQTLGLLYFIVGASSYTRIFDQIFFI